MSTGIAGGLKTLGFGLLFVVGGAILGGLGAGPFSLVLYLPGVLLVFGGGFAAVLAAQAVGEIVLPSTPALPPPPAEVPSPCREPTVDEIEGFSHNEFQSWAVRALGGSVSLRRSRDYGIDGYLDSGIPVQAKQSYGVPRPELDKFETAVRRSKNTKGVFVAFSFSPGTWREAARARADDGLDITLIEVGALLNGTESDRWTVS